MKKAFGWSIFLVGALALTFFIGLYVGRLSAKTPVPENSKNVVAAQATQTTNTVSTLININTANLEQLQQLPGVGEVLAQRIIDYRTQNGPFTSIQQLQNVSGIGNKTVLKLMELICLEDES